MARPLGSKNKLPSRAFIHDQLVERNWNVFDEFVRLYSTSPFDIQAKLMDMMMEYLFPKARPEDADGNPDPGILGAPLSPEQWVELLKVARGGK